MHSTTNSEKGRPGGTGAASTINAAKHTGCGCKVQACFPESAWISFACSVLPPLVTEQKAAFGTYSSPNAIAQIADEAGQFATAMLNVWLREGVAR